MAEIMPILFISLSIHSLFHLFLHLLKLVANHRKYVIHTHSHSHTHSHTHTRISFFSLLFAIITEYITSHITHSLYLLFVAFLKSPMMFFKPIFIFLPFIINLHFIIEIHLSSNGIFHHVIKKS